MLNKVFKFLFKFFSNTFNIWIDRAEKTILDSIDKTLSGAAIGFYQNQKLIYKKAFGYQRKYNQKKLMINPQNMSVNTIFDLASLTKIFSTIISYMYLVDRKQISINDKVSKYLSDFKGIEKSQVTIKDLMYHSAGLPSTIHFYDPKSAGPKFYSQNREKTIKLLPLIDLEYKPNTKVLYSDIGYMILGVIIEKITETRQDSFVSNEIYKPLKLANTGYRLMEDKGINKNAFEATELCGNTRDGNVDFPNIRNQTIQGQVQDEKAFYSMKGVSGHAGLFSSLDDLLVLSKLILNKGYYGSFQLCSEKTFDLFKNTKNFNNSYSLGFQIPSDFTESIYGLILKTGIGDPIAHTGWTGKCFLIDFEFSSILLLMTNKKHSFVIPYDNFSEFQGDLTATSKYSEIVDYIYAYNLNL